MMRRLPQPFAGEWIDRTRPLTMTFEGETIEAFAGDTLSSALAASGLMITARSFKYHRPRGLFSAAGFDANNLFQIGVEPNQRGDHILARDGLVFSAVNTHGGVANDRAAAMRWLARFLPVGFYYKVFLNRGFTWFERTIRAFSGLGTVKLDAPGKLRQRRHAHCDVAIVGAGVSGMAAALAAANAGAQRVVLIDESPQPGGSGLWHAKTKPDDAARCRELVKAVRAKPAIELMLSHSVVGNYADHELVVARIDREDGGLVLLRAGALVLATGVIDQPAVFHNNDLPGVLLGSAAQRLLYRHGISVGERIAVAGSGPDAAALVDDLNSHGLEARLLPAGAISAVAGSDGTLAAVEATGADGIERFECDALLQAYGWMPALQLALQRGGTLRFDAALGQHLPDAMPAGLFVAGRANGCFALDARLEDGHAAGEWATCHALGRPLSAPRSMPRSTARRSHHLPLFPSPRGKEFVDLDEDLTLADLANAAQEGFDSVELMKRYSTVGMGPSQGKLSNLNAARQLARVTGRELPSLGLTTARPPWQPVSMGALAGTRFSPLRRTALDEWHASQGAQWMNAGAWRRPAYYGSADQAAAMIAREVAAVRNTAGLIDVSTLGKIELMGPDAGELLDRLYSNRLGNLAIGRTRYALMLDESGVVIDDGVAMRLANGRFYITTTTGNSASIYREMQRRVAEWRLDCTLHNVTGHMVAMNLAGPHAREILKSCTWLDVSEAAFPYLALREGEINGIPVRMARVGFVGELGYEIHVPYAHAPLLWEHLLQAGMRFGLQPFGVEAQRVLRLEKGHIIIGQDTDGLTNPFEAGFGKLAQMNKPFFVGQRSLAILQQRGMRQLLAGFVLDEPRAPLAECHLAIANGEMAGRITSIAWSATLQKTVGLALLAPHLAVPDTRIEFRDDGGQLHAARVVATPFYDPQNLRQKPEAA